MPRALGANQLRRGHSLRPLPGLAWVGKKILLALTQVQWVVAIMEEGEWSLIGSYNYVTREGMAGLEIFFYKTISFFFKY